MLKEVNKISIKEVLSNVVKDELYNDNIFVSISKLYSIHMTIFKLRNLYAI